MQRVVQLPNEFFVENGLTPPSPASVVKPAPPKLPELDSRTCDFLHVVSHFATESIASFPIFERIMEDSQSELPISDLELLDSGNSSTSPPKTKTPLDVRLFSSNFFFK